jgi:abhydrolase domain-containing protein 14
VSRRRRLATATAWPLVPWLPFLATACGEPPRVERLDVVPGAANDGAPPAEPSRPVPASAPEPSRQAPPVDPDAPDPRQRVKPVWRGGKAPAPSETPPAADARWLQVEQHDIDFRGKNLRTLRVGKPGWPEVLLLHGARFDCRNWLELGTLEVLAAAGFRAVAIDLPGYGRSSGIVAKEEEFLWLALPMLDLKQPVVVFPSMSGRFAFPLIVDHPAALKGIVPIAPVGVNDWGPKIAGKELPALVVWGESDTVVPIQQAEMLRQLLPNSEKLILGKAGHPCYQDDPEGFHAGLLRFLAPFKPAEPVKSGGRPRR